MMNKTYKSIFPTFEEIDNDKVEIIERTYFKTVNGEKKQYHRLSLELIIANRHFAPLFDRIFILRDRTGKRVAFQPTIAGVVWPPCFKYDEKGWTQCIEVIKQEVITFRKYTTNILNEEDI